MTTIKPHAHPGGPIEAKASVPAIATSGVVLVVAAVLALLQAFGVDLTPEQVGAIMGLVAALLPAVQFVVAYLTPHTPRPDVHLQQHMQGQ